MVKIKITVKNFSYGSKLYGTGGIYTVEPAIAKALVTQGKAILVEGTLPSDDIGGLETANLKNQIMQCIKDNAVEIMNIFTETVKAQEAKEAFANIEMSADLTVESPKDEPNTDEGSDKTSDSVNTQSDENEDDEDASSNEDSIPEDFPGRDHLLAAGIDTIAKIPTTKEGLMEIEGIGARLANQIGVKLAQG